MIFKFQDYLRGVQISQIADKAKSSPKSLDPNIILLHAGTNDLNMGPPIDPNHAPDRLGALIDQLIQTSPDAVILVAQIINSASAQTQALIEKYNDAIPAVVAQRAGSHHVAVVNFRNSLLPTDYADSLHPNDGGYRKMADIWFRAIQDAAAQNPRLGSQGSASASGRYCLTKPFWVEALKDQPIALGVGHNGDMKFLTSWPHKPDAAPSIGKVGAGVVFADLNGEVFSYCEILL